MIAKISIWVLPIQFLVLGLAISFAEPSPSQGTLDSNFFDPKKDNTPASSKGPISGTERPIAQVPTEYTQEEYDLWLRQCESKKKDSENPKAFSDCFKQKRKEKQDRVRKSFEAVEEKQANPYKNIPLLDELSREPSKEDD